MVFSTTGTFEYLLKNNEVGLLSNAKLIQKGPDTYTQDLR